MRRRAAERRFRGEELDDEQGGHAPMTQPQAKAETPHEPIRRLDYRPPDYLIDSVALEFDLAAEATRVKAALRLRSNHDRTGGIRPLILDGEDLELRALALEGAPLGAADYVLASKSLILPHPPPAFTLEIETLIHPQANTQLSGLYLSQGVFCTQCEAEGFRRITYFLDRPDVMAVYRTTIRADRAAAPVLLSNGNLVEEGALADGRHYAVWHDPFPKPSYLFALVAGDLAWHEDRFTTRSGRDVRLRIFVEHGKEAKTRYAMDSLKRAMRWDEQRFGLEYDLDSFNIVAVSDFNMGAMENKSLNIFNDKYILADPETATDGDFAGVETVVGHEYFHNWTGDRITCRDWFQLSLKEGLTVFREQEFSSDMRSRAIERIGAVRTLRARQFPEDAGPLAHPVRPDSYIEINNFYTATVYQKGAEVIRMLHTILGEAGFQKGMRLYVERHDGEAVTCDDFVAAMADANGIDLAQFKLWYSQAGTPELEIAGHYDDVARAYELAVTQRCPPTPGQPEKAPMHIPLLLGFLDAAGGSIALRLAGEPAACARPERLLELRAAQERFRFVDLPRPRALSLNRGFSAPVILKAPQSAEDWAFLMAHDPDPFARWEAGQQYASDLLLRAVAARQRGAAMAFDAGFVAAIGAILSDAALEPAFAAEAIQLPGEDYLAERMPVIDVEGIHEAREALRRKIAGALSDELWRVYAANRVSARYSPDAAQAGRRALRNAALGYLAALVESDPAVKERLVRHFQQADNMTDRMAALRLLVDLDGPERQRALDDFYRRFAHDALVLDKWLALQAVSARPDTLERVKELMTHPAFSLKNPNKVRALIGTFTAGNPLRYHAADGAGYAFHAERTIELDALNPQVAARLLTALGRWRRFDPGRQAKMKAALERILAAPKLSRDVYEIAKKSLS
jgi:aminopeptidase N